MIVIQSVSWTKLFFVDFPGDEILGMCHDTSSKHKELCQPSSSKQEQGISGPSHHQRQSKISQNYASMKRKGYMLSKPKTHGETRNEDKLSL